MAFTVRAGEKRASLIHSGPQIACYDAPEKVMNRKSEQGVAPVQIGYRMLPNGGFHGNGAGV
jgi:hypothetical protein